MNLYKALILPLLLLLLASCSQMDDPCAEDSIMLSFRMRTSGVLTGSRADAGNAADSEEHVQQGSEYRAFEDAIDLNDFAMYIFAKEDGSEGDEKLIFSYNIRNSVANDKEDYQIIGGLGDYTVNVTMPRTKFSERLGAEIDPMSDKPLIFRILILSGVTESGGTAGSDKPNPSRWRPIDNLTDKTYNKVIETLYGNATQTGWLFKMGNIYKNPVTSSSSGGDNSGDNTGNDNSGAGEREGNNDIELVALKNVEDFYPNVRKYIPMFGTATTKVTQLALFNSRLEERIEMGDVYMLRSMAKIRVVDNIGNKTAGYPKIIDSSFFGDEDNIMVIPCGSLEDAENYINGNQVHEAHVDDSGDNGNYEYKLGVMNPVWTTIPAAERKGDVFVGYVPEMNIGATTTKFRIIVALSENADGTLNTKEYEVPMNGYPNAEGTGTINFGTQILRNHIYTLSVEEVKVEEEKKFVLKVAVNDWITREYIYEY